MAAAVDRHFTLLRAEELLRPGMTVCLKPNLLMKAEATAAITTHPALVEAVIRKLKSMGITDITIADSPGGPFGRAQLEGIYRATGLWKVAKETGATLNLDVGFEARKTEDATLCREFNLIHPIARADAVINLPKLKTHGMVMLSAGVKNLFGCVPGLQKPELHFRFREKSDFCRMLVDLSLLVKPVLTIVDAVDSMEGNGPSGGTIRHTGMIFGSRNLYALDLALCAYVGFSPDEVLTVRHAVDSHLCPATAAEIDWLGEKPDSLPDFTPPDSRPHNFTSHAPAFLRKPTAWLLEHMFESRPVILRDRCIGCGKCAESCAPGAAVVRERKAVIDRKICIKCYCCHEFCPVKAVHIKRPFFVGK
jgi:uncharacterized protein (DUF362 family)/Pyruvate/2-oxoacid:ferredoxin oxidoreductase delta subunit